MNEKIRGKILKILKEQSKRGLTITELVKISKLSRHSVITALTKLEGAKKVSFKQTGMAKVYFSIGGKK